MKRLIIISSFFRILLLVSIKLKLFYLSRNKVSVDESVDGKYKSALNNQIRSVHKPSHFMRWLNP